MTPYEIANSDAIKTQALETGRLQVWAVGGKDVDQYVDAVRAVFAEFGWEAGDLQMRIVGQQLHVDLRHRQTRAEQHGEAMANWGGW
jgi:hypothetical protein